MKKSLLAAAVILCCAISVRPAVSASAAGSADYRYQRAGDVGYTALTAADILGSCYNSPLGEAERAFLADGGFRLTYSPSIGASNVNVSADGERLRVTAKTYSYVAENGSTVVWEPVRAELGGRELAAAASGWTGTAGDEDGDSVFVIYETGFPVPAEEINALRNQAYNAGMDASERFHAAEEAYRAAMEEYEAAQKAYEDYLARMEEYEAAQKAYEDYLVRRSAWEKEDRKYREYLAEAEQYAADKAAYDNYQNVLAEYDRALAGYQKYQAERADYEKALSEYEAKTDSPEAKKALYQLTVLDYITKPVTHLGRTLSGSILGNSVTQVLSQTEAFVAAGAPRDVIELAYTATVNLRRLLNQYLFCGSDEARYGYYILCRDELSKNFNDLFRCLDHLYHGYQLVRGAIRQYERTEQFQILLAQLFYICNALSDLPVEDYETSHGKDGKKTYYDSGYRIGVGASKKTPAEVVGDDGVLEDRDEAEPLPGGYPNLPERPQPPKAVDHPGVRPTRPRLPEPPEPVDDPGAPPQTVGEPELPAEAPQPSLPQKTAFTETELALIAAYEGGELQPRAEQTSPFTVTVRTSVEKYFRNAKWVTVRFYADRSRETLLDTVDEASLGSYLEYGGPLPEKERTGYTCVFDGWEDEEGRRIDVNRLQTDKNELDLFPVFRETPIDYSVVWSVGGEVFRDVCPYDSIPRYDEEKFAPLQRPAAGVRLSRFVGWQSGDTLYKEELPKMTEETVRYTAVFEESFVVTFSAAGREYAVPVWPGDTPDPVGIPTERETDGYYRYEFTGWSPEISPARSDGTCVARYRAEQLLVFEGGGGRAELGEEGYVADCTAAPSRTFSAGGLLLDAAEKGAGVRFLVAGGEISADAETVSLLAKNGTGKFSLGIVQTSANTYRYLLTVAGNARADLSYSFTFTASGNFDEENSYLYDRTADTETRFRLIDRNGGRAVRFTMEAGHSYELVKEYAVGVIGSEYAEVTTSRPRAQAGERVGIFVDGMAAGMYLGSAFAVADDGTELPVEDMSFVMPKGAVTVGIVTAYYTYTVVFRVDGKTIATRTYRYGEEIVPPENPVKPSDETCSYTFEGWGELLPVTGDAVYDAVFRPTPLPPVVMPDTALNKLIRAAYFVVPAALLLLIGLAAFITVRCVRKRKKGGKKARKEAKKG